MAKTDEIIASLKRKYAVAFDGQAMQNLAVRCAHCGFDEKVRDEHLATYRQAITVVQLATEDSDDLRKAHQDLVMLGVDVSIQEALAKKPQLAAAGAQDRPAVTVNDAPSGSSAAQLADQEPPKLTLNPKP